MTALVGGPIVLQVPAEASMSRVVRLTASSLAALARMSVDDIDDVKIVVSEVMAALIEHGDGAEITVKFEIAEHRLTIAGYTSAHSYVSSGDDIALSATVLAAIASNHSVQHTDGQLLITATYDAVADPDDGT